MKPALALSFLLSLAMLVQAQEKIDLAEYKTPATAIAAKISPSRSSDATPQAAYLGISVSLPVEKNLAVDAVEPNSPAAKAGILPGQIIRKYGTHYTSSVEHFREWLHSHEPGDEVIIGFLQNDKILLRKITLGAASQPMVAPVYRVILGVRYTQMPNGLVLSSITPGSAASKANLKINDIFLKVDGQDITSRVFMSDYLMAKKPGEFVRIQLLRDRKPLEVIVKLEGAQAEITETLNWDNRRRTIFQKPTYHLAVLPIEFPDQKLNEKVTTANWEEALFSRGTYHGKKNATGTTVYGSVHDYYQEVSFDRLKVEGKVFEPIVVTRTRNDYSLDANKSALLTDVLDKWQAKYPKTLDTFDGVFFLYAGSRFAKVRNNVFWPHCKTINYHKGKLDVFVSPEGGEKMSTISTITHEFGHMLGLPDLYALPEVPGMEGAGEWCTMSNGEGAAGRPVHFSAWCKETMGWIRPTVIDPSVKQKLILSPSGTSPTEAFKILVRPDGSEYFLLENRYRTGFDKDLPADGLLIWRVVGKNKPLLVGSHGVTGPEGPKLYLGMVPFPSKANHSFTPYTMPSSRSPMGGGLPVHLTNIRRLPDGRITFHIGYEFY